MSDVPLIGGNGEQPQRPADIPPQVRPLHVGWHTIPVTKVHQATGVQFDAQIVMLRISSELGVFQFLLDPDDLLGDETEQHLGIIENGRRAAMFAKHGFIQGVSDIDFKPLGGEDA